MGTLLNDLEVTTRMCRNAGLRPDVTRIKLKEKLQLFVLDFIYNRPPYNELIFYGGTCLRICFQLNRMSEDIDFETTTPFDKKKFADAISDYFAKHHQYPLLTAHVPGKGIERIELRFPVLFELGLSPHAAENLMIKVEVNSIEKSYPTELKLLAKDRFSLVIRHYDLPTLMAGKMLACLNRVWVKKGAQIKGRDYYDLLWYMGQGIRPNADRLADAKRPYSVQEAFETLSEKIETIKERDLLTDLIPLFENNRFAEQWVSTFKSQFRQLYQKY